MYLKLGKQASVFYDPSTRLYIANKQVVEYKGPRTKRLAIALKNGAVEETKEAPETPTTAPSEDAGDTPLKTTLSKMTEAELLAYYKENYDVNEEEEEAFNKLKSKKAKVAFLLDDEE